MTTTIRFDNNETVSVVGDYDTVRTLLLNHGTFKGFVDLETPSGKRIGINVQKVLHIRPGA